MKPYPFERPVSGSMINCMWSILPKGSKIPFNISSVILKCNEPTYSLIGPAAAFWSWAVKVLAALFFSAKVGWTTIGTPKIFWPDSPRAYE